MSEILFRRLAPLVAMALVALAPAVHAQEPEDIPLDPVVVTGDPVAASPDQPGTGLCSTSRFSTRISTDFSQRRTSFIGNLNDFLDAVPNASNPNVRTTAVLRTLLDLSNNNIDTTRTSYGDFANAVPGCPEGGCGFALNGNNFGSRLRGYLNVTPAMVGRPIHFGIYADDAVALTLYDRLAVPYAVINRPPKLGEATWRITNSVTFLKSGLYGVELLYVSLTENAALEMSVFVGDFSDFQRGANTSPIVRLKEAGFSLVAPTSLYQTESGRPSYPDLNQCQQCNREAANKPSNSSCGPSYYCNGAALCAPCDSAVFCGPSCSPCGQSTPACVNRNGTFTCAECTKDSDCKNGRCDPETNQCRGCNTDAQCSNGQHCDTEAHECRDCVTNDHCGRGQTCVDNTCQACSAQDSCAGTSCNCCPGGLKCASPTPGASPTCVECSNDNDCADGKRCDVANGRCVTSIAACNTSERCGEQCAKCPTDRPYCLDGQVCVSCRSDLECGDGKFCLSGECASCTTDKRCGARCGACDADKPFCLTDGTTTGSSCVGCRENADCGPGGTCDTATHTCSATTCTVTCGEGSVCLGEACVQCFADAHCPCGGTCDTALNVCTTSCNDSNDCLGTEYCSALTQQCEPGRRKPGTEAAGGPPCCGVTTQGAPLALGLLLLAVLLARRPRGEA
ncbi:outer membrane exchange protein TraA [Archangium primigenium]|uniref:outer membrane exchange protein TraA n=1 Tax=[Archangium] primigenium TaxID=2792470 RepID=UPI0030844107